MIIKAIAVKDISKSGRKGPVSNANGIKQICAKRILSKMSLFILRVIIAIYLLLFTNFLYFGQSSEEII